MLQLRRGHPPKFRYIAERLNNVLSFKRAQQSTLAAATVVVDGMT